MVNQHKFFLDLGRFSSFAFQKFPIHPKYTDNIYYFLLTTFDFHRILKICLKYICDVRHISFLLFTVINLQTKRRYLCVKIRLYKYAETLGEYIG